MRVRVVVGGRGVGGGGGGMGQGSAGSKGPSLRTDRDYAASSRSCLQIA